MLTIKPKVDGNSGYFAKISKGSPVLATFGFGTDLHSADIPNLYGYNQRDGAPKLQDAVNFWNTITLDFVMLNGDYVDDAFGSFGTSRSLAANLADLDRIEVIFSKVSVPRKYLFGNHDMISMSKANFIAHTSMPAKNYSWDINGIHFIALDADFSADTDGTDYDTSNFTQLIEFIPPGERTWLASDLAATSLPCVVFCHMSLDNDSSNLNVDNAPAVRTILEASGKVIAVITGHEHTNRKSVINGIPYYSMMAMTTGTYPTNAYAVVNVYSNKIVVKGQGGQTSYS